jgi:hypothetical protein
MFGLRAGQRSTEIALPRLSGGSPRGGKTRLRAAIAVDDAGTRAPGEVLLDGCPPWMRTTACRCGLDGRAGAGAV